MMKIKELRKEQGLTQHEVAKYLGISRAGYANIENGKRETDYESLFKLAALFHVSIDYLLGFSDQKGEFTPLNEDVLAQFLHDPRYKELYERLVKLNPQNLQIALAALDGIINHQADQDEE